MSSPVNSLPAVLVILICVLFLVGAGLVFYALRMKGHVHAEFSHGSTKFLLDASDRYKVHGPNLQSEVFSSERDRSMSK